jgi:hypothetical protein
VHISTQSPLQSFQFHHDDYSVSFYHFHYQPDDNIQKYHPVPFLENKPYAMVITTCNGIPYDNSHDDDDDGAMTMSPTKKKMSLIDYQSQIPH